MNVLYITHNAALYGANRSLLNVMDNMRQYHEIVPHVILPDLPGELAQELKKRNVPYSIYFFRPWIREIGKKKPLQELVKKLINAYAVYKIRRDIVKWNIDLVHTNSICTEVGLKAAIKEKKPHIQHIREFMEEDYSVEFYLAKKKALALINQSTKIIAISKAVYDKYLEYIPASKLVLIHNGVEVPKTVKSIGFPENYFKILLAGLISPQKGTKEAIDAIKELLRRGYRKIRLWIAGSGGEFESYLKQYVQETGLGEYIIFLGYRKDIDDLRNKADVCLVCSRFEAFGRVTVEAMLAKVPVIAANTAGTAEIIKHMETGLLYDSGSYMDLADKMLFSMNNYSQMIQVSENAHFFALQNFTIKKNVAGIYREYLSIS